MIMKHSFIILLSFILFVDGKISCLQSFNPHSKIREVLKECPIEGDSCVTFYTNDNLTPRYSCLSKFEFFSPQFRDIECPKEPHAARCFASSTGKSIHRVFLHGIIHLPMSDVLHRAGIDRLCCCGGFACNNNNEKMKRFFLNNDRIDSDYVDDNLFIYGNQMTNVANSKSILSSITVYFFFNFFCYYVYFL